MVGASRPVIRAVRRACAVGAVTAGLWAGVVVSPGTPLEAVVPVAAAHAAPAAYDTASENAFLQRINDLRASKGLNRLTVHGELLGVARRWTDKMVAAGRISHNPNLGNEVSAPWRKLGENVGVGYDVEGLWQAFVNSPGHYKNLVDPAWTHVAVGAVRAGDGRLFTTHNFMRLEGGGSPPPTTAPPAPKPAPRQDPAPARSTPKVTAPAKPAPPPPPPEPVRPPANPDRVAAVLTALQPLSG
jgi:hypothetical protein